MIASRGIAYLSAGRRQAAGWFRPEPISVSGSAFEVALFDAHTRHAEVGAVAQHGEPDAAEPMSDGYHRGLVTAPRADPDEVRMLGMGRTARVVRRLA